MLNTNKGQEEKTTYCDVTSNKKDAQSLEKKQAFVTHAGVRVYIL